MKNLKCKSLLLALALVPASAVLLSCSEEDSPVPSTDYMTGIVTVRNSADDGLSLQITDAVKLRPTNLSKSPFGDKEVRAVVNYNLLDQSDASTWLVHVNTLDSMRTKPMIASASADDDKRYGNDPLEIVKSWATCVEDGYLTLRFRTRWGSQRTVHYLNLVMTSCKDNVCELELHQNAGGDLGGKMGDALIAFKLDGMPKLEGTNAKVRLSWMSYTGRKTAEFFVNEGGRLFDPEGEFSGATDEAAMGSYVE